MLSPALLLPLLIAPPEGGEPIAAVQAIVDESCTLCHDASDDMLNLEDVGALIHRPSTTGKPLIDPGNPNNSYLYLKMVGAEGIEGEPMPLGDDPLPVDQLRVMQEWIAGLSPVSSEPGVGEIDGAAVDQDGQVSGQVSGEPGPVAGPLPREVRRSQPFHGTHQINLQTTTTLGKRTIAYRIHHRLGRVGGIGDRSYIGLAGPAVISMGLEYGIIDGLDVLARWTNARLGWELGLKYVPVRQEDGMPLSFGMFASFEALTDFPTTTANRFTGNFQILVSRLWFERWSTQLVVNYSMLTNHAPVILYDFGDGPVRVTDDRGTLDLGLASTVWLGKRKRHGIDLEYILPVPNDSFYYHGGDVDPEGTKIGAWALGWSAKTGMHLFQVFVSNTRNIHTNLVAPGGDTHNPFKPFGDFFFGFNISRKWKL